MSEHSTQLDVCLEKWKQFDKHAEESVPIRDEVKALRLEVNNIKGKIDNFPQEILRNAIIGGIIGGLIGNATPEVFRFLVGILFGR